MRTPVFTAWSIAVLVSLSAGYIYGVQYGKQDREPRVDRSTVCDNMAGRSATRLQHLNGLSDALFDDIVGVVYANCLIMEKTK